MLCPRCSNSGSVVVDSRRCEDGRRYRRRECHSCGYRYNTWEVSEEELVSIYQKKPSQGSATKEVF